MNMLTLAPAVFLAGVLMFLAPCTLPLIPAYIAFVAGTPSRPQNGGEDKKKMRRKMFMSAVWFVLGFSLIFVAFGVFASALGAFLGEWRYTLARLSGILLILFGVMMLGARLPFLSYEWHAHVPRSLTLGHPFSSFLFGALFALGWSPCIGPVLGSALLLASTKGALLQGGLLLFIFSLGFAVPFLLTAALVDQASQLILRFSRFAPALYAIGGSLLIGVGTLVLFNKLGLILPLFLPLTSGTFYERLINLL